MNVEKGRYRAAPGYSLLFKDDLTTFLIGYIVDKPIEESIVSSQLLYIFVGLFFLTCPGRTSITGDIAVDGEGFWW